MTTETLNDLERIGRLLNEGKIDQNDYALLKQQIIKGAQPELTGSSTEDSNSAPSVSVDRYEETALSGEIGGAGWYPDPNHLGTHMRFFDGESWTDKINRVDVRVGIATLRDRGPIRCTGTALHSTDEYGLAPVKQMPPRGYRWWLGIALVVLGGFSIVAVAVNDPALTPAGFVLGVILNPLVWAGAGGVFLMRNDDALQRTK